MTDGATVATVAASACPRAGGGSCSYRPYTYPGRSRACAGFAAGTQAHTVPACRATVMPPPVDPVGLLALLTRVRAQRVAAGELAPERLHDVRAFKSCYAELGYLRRLAAAGRGDGGHEHAPAGHGPRGLASGVADRRRRGVGGPGSASPHCPPASGSPAVDGPIALADRHRPRRRGASHRARASRTAGRQCRGAAGRRASFKALAGSIREGAQHRVSDGYPHGRRPWTAAGCV